MSDAPIPDTTAVHATGLWPILLQDLLPHGFQSLTALDFREFAQFEPKLVYHPDAVTLTSGTVHEGKK